MKHTLIGLLLLLSAKAHAAEVISEDEEYYLLRSLDSICGDSWCEGEANWSFDALDCDTDKGCSLDLTMQPYPFSDEVQLEDRKLDCDLYEFSTRAALIEETDRGIQYTQGLYSAVNSCITELLDQFGPMYVPIAKTCPDCFKSGETKTITLKDELEGIDAALWAVKRLIRDQAKKNEACELTTLPAFRDDAKCEINSKTETCHLPSQDGNFRIKRTLATGVMSVRFYPAPNPAAQH